MMSLEVMEAKKEAKEATKKLNELNERGTETADPLLQSQSDED